MDHTVYVCTTSTMPTTFDCPFTSSIPPIQEDILKSRREKGGDDDYPGCQDLDLNNSHRVCIKLRGLVNSPIQKEEVKIYRPSVWVKAYRTDP